MGLFDSVWVPCPNCGKPTEFQSKEDECFMNNWDTDKAPTAVLWDIMNEPHYHRECDSWVVLVDPNHPPGARPRPNLTAKLVRAPENPFTHSQGMKWWPDDRPFTYEDLLASEKP